MCPADPAETSCDVSTSDARGMRDSTAAGCALERRFFHQIIILETIPGPLGLGLGDPKVLEGSPLGDPLDGLGRLNVLIKQKPPAWFAHGSLESHHFPKQSFVQHRTERRCQVSFQHSPSKPHVSRAYGILRDPYGSQAFRGGGKSIGLTRDHKGRFYTGIEHVAPRILLTLICPAKKNMKTHTIY